MTTTIQPPPGAARSEATTSNQKRDSWLLVVTTLAAFSLVGTIVAVGIAIADRDRGGAAGAGGAVTIEVELGDLYISPATIEVPAGATVTFEVTNVGAMPHDFVVGELGATSMLDPGAGETLVIDGIDSSVQAWCSVAGHREAGMEADITVTGGGTGTHDGHGGGTGIEAATGDFAEIDFNAAPGADWVPFDPVLQPAPGGTEHEITLTMEETVIEVAPGVTQELWTFNQQFPGPVLRGKVGDIFTITVVNEGEMGHSIDFHASKVAMNDEMRTLQPGESLVYQFEAKHAGAYMYHCGTAPTLHHIGNGMHGALIVDPPDLAPVDKEFIFVQSEIYTGPEGQPGDLTKMQDEEWDAVVFNGYVNQYVHAPIETDVDERIRVWVVDNGPSENSSFHIVGTIFDTTYKEGTKLLWPDERRGGSQALDLQPAQGGYVEFTFDEPGMYVGVTHKFANVGKGAQIAFHAGGYEGTGGGH